MTQSVAAVATELKDHLSDITDNTVSGTQLHNLSKHSPMIATPLMPVVVPIVDRWSAGKSPGEWLFAAPAGRPAAGNELAAVGQLA